VALVVVGIGRYQAGAVPPVLLELMDPGVELNKVLTADVVDAGAAVLGIGSTLDESGVAEDA
jgi:hypothetical protein